MSIISHSEIGDYFVAEMQTTNEMWISDPYGEFWFPEIDSWCKSTFGETDFWGENPDRGWKRLLDKYYFTEKELLTMFTLRWS